MISEKQLAANRRNAARSTGPKTTEGKAASRRNAVTHGLRAAVVPVEDGALVDERAVGVHAALRPQNAFQAWACAGVALITTRLDRLREIEARVRAGVCWRADHFWEEDQRLEANRVGGQLARDPARVVGQLRRSVAGTDWLIERWTRLAAIAGRLPWTADQAALVHDLLGTPPNLRNGPPCSLPDAEATPGGADSSEASLARSNLADLQTHRERVVEADAMARNLAAADLADFSSRDLTRLRRYERSLQADLRRYFALSQFESPHAAPAAPRLAAIPPQFVASAPSAPPAEPMGPTPTAPNEPILATSEVPEAACSPSAPPATPPARPGRPEPQARPEDAREPARSAAQPPRPTAPAAPIAAPFAAPNEPILPDLASLAASSPQELSAAIRAYMEADLPEPGTLDPAWCQAYLAEMLTPERLKRLDRPI